MDKKVSMQKGVPKVSRSPIYRKDIVQAELRGDWSHLKKSDSTSYKVKK